MKNEKPVRSKKRRTKKEIFFQNNTRQKECISCVPFPFY